jgi:hypothetical protein
MTKPVTRDRILVTHAKIDAFCNHLTDADMHIVRTAARYGFKAAANNIFGIKTPQIETDKARLEMTVNDVMSPTHGEMVINRLFGNIDRCHKKRDKVRLIQFAHKISGLEMGIVSLGNGAIECWQPSKDKLWITDDDLDLLRGDRLKLLQFWIDHVLLNNLQVLKDVGCDRDWETVTIEYVQLMSRDYDWAHFWEEKKWLQVDYSQPIRHSSDPDRVCGHLFKTSSAPQEGFKKHHEIHLVLGTGKNFDSPEKSMYFCATNGVQPFE